MVKPRSSDKRKRSDDGEARKQVRNKQTQTQPEADYSSDSEMEGGLMENDEYKVRLQQWSEQMQEDVAMIDQNETVDVDFDFFSLREDDFLTVKYHWKTLFDSDNTALDLSELSELLIAEGQGVCIKSDGEEGEPLALMSALDLAKVGDKPCMKTLMEYLVERSENCAPKVYRTLRRLMASPDSKAAIVICERLVNLPWELLPHLYNLFKQELEEQNTSFDQLIILTRGYVFENSSEQGYFHYEDPELVKLASESGFYDYKRSDRTEASRSAFTEEGITPKGGVIVLDGKKLGDVVSSLQNWVQELSAE